MVKVWRTNVMIRFRNAANHTQEIEADQLVEFEPGDQVDIMWLMATGAITPVEEAPNGSDTR